MHLFPIQDGDARDSQNALVPFTFYDEELLPFHPPQKTINRKAIREAFEALLFTGGIIGTATWLVFNFLLSRV